MIFNKSSNGSSELKEHIGFLWKSINFANLTTYIKSATRDLKQLIGADFYALIEAHYLSDNFNKANENDKEMLLRNELVILAQCALAFGAYRRYAPTMDVTHGDKGRQIFVSTEEKPAFEWQIERDNENILNLEYEQIEILLEYLFENIDEDFRDKTTPDPNAPTPIMKTFKDSDIINKRKDLFVNDVETFENVFPLNSSRRLMIAITPFIRESQNKFVRPCFTSENWEAFKEKYIANEIDEDAVDDYRTLELLRIPLCLMTMSIAAKRLSVSVLPDSVVRKFSSEKLTMKSSTPALRDERMEFAKMLEQEAYSSLRALQQHLSTLAAKADNTTYTPDDLTMYMKADNKYLSL